MKIYCQFKVLSTGYISGTIPPQYSEDNKKPIDMLGSDGVYILDARKNINSLMSDCVLRLNKLRLNHIVQYEIVRSEDFYEGKVLYRSELLF